MQPERGRPLQERGRPRPQNNPILTCFPESCSLVFVAGEDARVPGEPPAFPEGRPRSRRDARSAKAPLAAASHRPRTRRGLHRPPHSLSVFTNRFPSGTQLWTQSLEREKSTKVTLRNS